MKIYESENLRNLSVVGHGDTGKTSLVSALLFRSGTVNRLGKVDDKNTVTDYDEEEQDRGISIDSALAHLEWKDHKFNVIDTPGYADFFSHVKPALKVTDGAVVTVSGVAGAEVQTEKAWRILEEYDMPGIVVANMMDRERAEFSKLVENLQEKLGRNIVPLQLPLGKGEDFKGVVDLMKMKSYEYKLDESGHNEEQPIPDNLQDEVEERRSELVEMVAEMDDELLEKYFEAGELTQDELVSGFKKAVVGRDIYPLFLTSATANIGVDKILNGVINYLPSPVDNGAVSGSKPDSDREVRREPSVDVPFSSYVFKTISDPYTGRISVFRVYSGSLKADDTVYNSVKDTEEKLSGLFLLQGDEQFQIPELKAGDIAATAKLKETTTGDTLCSKDNPVVFESVEYPEPATMFALEPESRGDEEKLSSALKKVTEADPSVKVNRDKQTNELLIHGNGQLHLEVIVEKLKKNHEIGVVLKPPTVPYRETIKKKSSSHYRHKKQSGGRGQFAEVDIRLEPLPGDKDYEFVDEIFGGVIPSTFVPSVDKGIQEAREEGYLAGYPVDNFKVVLYDGDHHDVDSSEMAFKIAAEKAFRKAVENAAPTILEPIMEVEVLIPEDCMGDVMGDLNGRRGKVQGMDPRGTLQKINAKVPMAEMLNYASSLKSITGGRGSYSMEMSHYEEVPRDVRKEIIEDAKKQEEEE